MKPRHTSKQKLDKLRLMLEQEITRLKFDHYNGRAQLGQNASIEQAVDYGRHELACTILESWFDEL